MSAVRVSAALTLLVLVVVVPRAATGQSAADTGQPLTTFGRANVSRLQHLLAEQMSSASGAEDYYVVLIGDVQNGVRTFRHDVFEAIARDVRAATDERSGERIYERVRFVILLGDLVYEGPDATQWKYFERALSGVAPDGSPYPNLAALARDKAVLPAVGNHELLHFRLRPQTRDNDLFDDPDGVANFKAFFAWDDLIAHPQVLYPVPTEVPGEAFRRILSMNPGADAQRALSTHYAPGPDGRYRLTWVEDALARAAAGAWRPGREPIGGTAAGGLSDLTAEKQALAAVLAPMFRRAGYGTLPVLNSDDMAAYALDTGSIVYLFLDSMARGWHYPAFARLKTALYADKEDRHRLNLFSDSPFNGQIDFFRAVAAYARDHRRTLVPLMHHSILNSSKSIFATGLGYNYWLAFGFPYAAGEPPQRTMLDDILSSGARNIFTACVHGFEDFSVVVRRPGQADHTLRWIVSGGGGGPLRQEFPPERIRQTVSLYNERLAQIEGTAEPSTIEIRDHRTRVGHHYLLVHVRNGQLVDIAPRFLGPEDVPAAVNGPQVVLRSSTSTGAPIAAGIDVIPMTWGLEHLYAPLAFVNWRPSIGVGVVGYDRGGPTAPELGLAASVEASPFSLDVYMPGANLVTLHLPGVEVWAGRSTLAFLTMGAELPILGNLFDRLAPLTVGITVAVPVGASDAARREFGGGTRVGLTVGFRFGRSR